MMQKNDIEYRLGLTRRKALGFYHKAMQDSCASMSDYAEFDYAISSLRTGNSLVFGAQKRQSDKKFILLYDARSFGVDSSADSRRLIHNRVSDFQFLNSLVTIYHEAHHARQDLAIDGQLTYDKFSPDIAVSKIAAVQNYRYYMTHHKHFLHEVDAQSYGVFGAYGFLMTQFAPEAGLDRKTVEAVFLSYLNNSTVFGLYNTKESFGRTGFESMDDVFQAFDKSYDTWSNEFAQKRYNGRYKDDPPDYDEFYAAAGLGNAIPPYLGTEWDMVWRDFLFSSDTPKDACYKLCCLSTALHPEYFEHYSCLESIRDALSYKNCFSRYESDDFPEPAELILARTCQWSSFSKNPRGLSAVRSPEFNTVSVVSVVPDVEQQHIVSGDDLDFVPDAVDREFAERESVVQPRGRPVIRPQSRSGRDLRGLDVDPDNSNNVSNDFERS